MLAWLMWVLTGMVLGVLILGGGRAGGSWKSPTTKIVLPQFIAGEILSQSRPMEDGCSVYECWRRDVHAGPGQQVGHSGDWRVGVGRMRAFPRLAPLAQCF